LGAPGNRLQVSSFVSIGPLLKLLIQKQHNQGLFQFARFKPKRSPAAFVGNAPLSIDKIQAIGHAAVGVSHAVVHFVHDHRNTDVKRSATSLGHALPFLLISRLLDTDARPVIGGHAPAIDWMDIANINRHEFGAVAESAFELFQGPELGPKRSSGKAAENQNHRLGANQFG
jgi:hypothetical protein